MLDTAYDTAKPGTLGALDALGEILNGVKRDIARSRQVLNGAFGHIAIGMPDVYKACEAVKAKGGKVTREPGPMKFGGSVIAFVEDPDGYKIEFIQRA